MKISTKLLLSPILIGLHLSLLFSLTSCDGGSDGNQTGSNTNNNGQGTNNVVIPPSNPTNTTASDNNGGNNTSAANVSNESAFSNDVFFGINAARNSNGGLAPLVRDSNLDAIAAVHSASMRDRAPANANPIQIDHNNFQTRGQQVFALGYSSVGENVAGVRGYPTAQVVNQFITGWINSPGHFKNIVGDFTHTGVSVLVDPRDGTIYATQVFAR